VPIPPCVCQLQSPPLQPSLCDLTPEGIRRHEVREDLLAVDLDDRNQLPEAGLELWVVVDRDLLQLKGKLLAKSRDCRPRLLAEMAAGRDVEAD